MESVAGSGSTVNVRTRGSGVPTEPLWSEVYGDRSGLTTAATAVGKSLAVSEVQPTSGGLGSCLKRGEGSGSVSAREPGHSFQ
jgi:hypothetical protein